MSGGRINTNQNPAFVEGGVGGGGYSTIEDKNGAALTARTILEFTSGLNAQDSGGVTQALLDLDHVNTFTKSQNVAAVGVTDQATIATDASLGNVFTVTLAGSRTLGNPTNLVAGGTYMWIITQGGAGSNTLAYGNLFTWPGGVAPVLSTAIGAVDIVTAVYDGAKLRAVFNLNFS